MYANVIEALAKWTPAKMVNGSPMRTAEPGSLFWDYWRDKDTKEEMRAAGISVRKITLQEGFGERYKWEAVWHPTEWK